VWAEDLTLEEAQKLKEKIAASGKSKTVRYENMEVPYPPEEPVYAQPAPRPAQPVRQPGQVGVTRRVPAMKPPQPPRNGNAKPSVTPERLEQLRGERQDNPYLEQMRQTALGAASGAAAEAQRRHDQATARQKLIDQAAELTKQAAALEQPIDIPPDGEAGDQEAESDLSDDDITSMLGEVEGDVTDDDLQAARAQRDAEKAEREAAEKKAAAEKAAGG
jgi:hypothetical protein